MKRLIIILLPMAFILSACATTMPATPSQGMVQTAIAQTMTAAFAPAETQQAQPTITLWPTTTSAPTATVGLGSMLDPYPMMTAASLRAINPGEVDFTVTVLEVARGPAVDAYVASDYPVVSLPSGMQFIFVKVDVNITSVAYGSSY